MIDMRNGKDGEYYFVTIESDEELEKLKELTLMIVKKRKEWNRDPNTWDGKFLVDKNLTKEKIKKILSS